MLRRRKYTPEQEKRIAEIHAELEAQWKRWDEHRKEEAVMSRRERDLFLELAFIGRGQI